MVATYDNQNKTLSYISAESSEVIRVSCQQRLNVLFLLFSALFFVCFFLEKCTQNSKITHPPPKLVLISGCSPKLSTFQQAAAADDG